MDEKKTGKWFVIFVVIALILLALNNIRMTLNQNSILQSQDAIFMQNQTITKGISDVTVNQGTLLESMKTLAENQKLTGKSLSTISENQILLQKNQETLLKAITK
jgi:hypothetical protein